MPERRGLGDKWGGRGRGPADRYAPAPALEYSCCYRPSVSSVGSGLELERAGQGGRGSRAGLSSRHRQRRDIRFSWDEAAGTSGSTGQQEWSVAQVGSTPETTKPIINTYIVIHLLLFCSRSKLKDLTLPSFVLRMEPLWLEWARKRAGWGRQIPGRGPGWGAGWRWHHWYRAVSPPTTRWSSSCWPA